MIFRIYFIILLLLLYIERNTENRINRLVRFLIPILYSFIVGFRGYYIGFDTHAYIDSYYYGGIYGLGFVEPGFDWINTQIYKLGYEAHVDLWVYAVITLAFIYLTLERLEKKYYSIAAFFFYFMTFEVMCNGMRQAVACSVLLYATKFIENSKPIIYACFIVAASTIHASALLLLPLYLLRYLKVYNIKAIWIIYLVSFIALFKDISTLIPAIEIGNRSYEMDTLGVEAASSLGFFIMTIINVIVLLHLTKSGQFKKNPLISYGILLAFILTNLAYSIPYLMRMATYFRWFSYLMYPVLYYDNNRTGILSKQAWTTLFVILTAAVFINTRIKYENEYYMYWQEPPATLIKYGE